MLSKIQNYRYFLFFLLFRLYIRWIFKCMLFYVVYCFQIILMNYLITCLKINYFTIVEIKNNKKKMHKIKEIMKN
jgi:hypothetical protein